MTFCSCGKNAHYGPPNKPAIHCAEHKKENEITRAKKCTEEKCKNRARYAPLNHVGALYCSKHKKENDVNKQVRLCTECTTQASYGKKDGKAVHCRQHAENDEIDLRSRKCTECPKQPSYAKPGNRATHCKQHAQSDEVDVKTPKCVNCSTHATYGLTRKKPIHCAEHKLLGEISYHDNQVCVKCKLPFRPPDKTILICKLCRGTNRISVKERKLLNFLTNLQELANKMTHKNKQTAENTSVCGRYRPDFVFDFNTHIVIIECDEFQHKKYEKSCEEVRMNNIMYGLGLPCVFIRWNPDEYKLNQKVQQISLNQRLKKLEEILQKSAKEVPKEMLTVVYLYYDDIAVV
jgi:hypothetical protein